MKNLLKIYIWLTKQPLKVSIPLVIGTGLIIAVFFPALPLKVKELIIHLIESTIE